MAGIFQWMLLFTLFTGSLGNVPMVMWAETPFRDPQQGETMVLRCDGTGELNRDAEFQLRIGRRRSVVNGDIMFYPIATDDVLNEQYVTLGRYSANFVTESDTLRYMELTITDLQGYDGGTWECTAPGSGSTTVVIHVNTPVEKVEFSSLNEHSQETAVDQTNPTITLEEGVASGISCAAWSEGSGTYPSAAITTPVNASNLFITKYVSEDEEMENMPDGIIDYKRIIKLQYFGSSPNYMWDGQMFTCTASMIDYGDISDTVTVNVLFKPVFRCESETFSGKEGEELVVSCSMFSNPQANVSLQWEDIKLSDTNTQMEGYKLEIKDGDERNEKVIEFTIESATEDDLMSTSIQLTSTNEYGTRMQNLRVRRENTSADNGGHRAILDTLTLCCMLLVLVGMSM